MTYIESAKKGEKEYFYLTKSIRIGENKWKKVRVYLGNKRPTKEDIRKHSKNIEKQAEKYAKSSYVYLEEKDAETLQDLKESYMVWLKQTPSGLRKKLNEDFVIRFTYNTNAIEGNRLTLRQTALILKDKIIPSGIRANDYNEAINGKECLEFLKDYNGEINNSFLEKINRILTKNTDAVYQGRIRFFDVQIHGSKHVPPKHNQVKVLLLNMHKWWSSSKNKLHPFELAALVHHKLTWIHPFEDGNGRTARAVMNFVLMKKGFPMFFIPFEKREEYYNLLEKADEEDYKRYVKGMLSLIIDQVRSYGHK